MAESNQKPVGKMSFEEALRELESVVGRLESADVPLDESITLYERGAALRARCEDRLREAEVRVSQITKGADGNPEAQPVDIS